MWYMPMIIGTYLGIPFIAKLVKEFLVKDYAIYKNAEKEEIIKNTLMSDCIKTYIDNEEIRILAEKSEWIGNDEAHYIRKQEGRDINDMNLENSENQQLTIDFAKKKFYHEFSIQEMGLLRK